VRGARVKITPQTVAKRTRLKVYELKKNDGWDRGTGFFTAVIIDVSKAYMKCPSQQSRVTLRGRRIDTLTFMQGEARLHVLSEHEPDGTLLEKKIMTDDAGLRCRRVLSQIHVIENTP
jgi:hypothetical protein